mmetsp:Transcript_25496/g.71326  ORF Transcript_25496/g.71326 Transcript_25496/m.71326 type:complete len:475 (-) Transcript_25496:848-2272(-)
MIPSLSPSLSRPQPVPAPVDSHFWLVVRFHRRSREQCQRGQGLPLRRFPAHLSELRKRRRLVPIASVLVQHQPHRQPPRHRHPYQNRRRSVRRRPSLPAPRMPLRMLRGVRNSSCSKRRWNLPLPLQQRQKQQCLRKSRPHRPRTKSLLLQNVQPRRPRRRWRVRRLPLRHRRQQTGSWEVSSSRSVETDQIRRLPLDLLLPTTASTMLMQNRRPRSQRQHQHHRHPSILPPIKTTLPTNWPPQNENRNRLRVRQHCHHQHLVLLLLLLLSLLLLRRGNRHNCKTSRWPLCHPLPQQRSLPRHRQHLQHTHHRPQCHRWHRHLHPRSVPCCSHQQLSCRQSPPRLPNRRDCRNWNSCSGSFRCRFSRPGSPCRTPSRSRSCCSKSVSWRWPSTSCASNKFSRQNSNCKSPPNRRTTNWPANCRKAWKTIRGNKPKSMHCSNRPSGPWNRCRARYLSSYRTFPFVSKRFPTSLRS